jgi:glycosyltransferase involved in cell wall biosynthesis
MIDPTNPDYANTPVSPQRPRYGYAAAEPLAPPCVTIITPFYNTGALFHETARSVLQQSLQQWEWLIVNDGSTDPEALSILESYRGSDPRIRVIDHEANRGPSAARNTGFRASSTPYVVQLDSDNLLESTAIEKWCWFLESYPEYGFVKGYSVGFGAEEYLWQKGFHGGRAFLQENLADPTGTIRRTVFEAAGGYDETNRCGLEDWDFWLRCANSGSWGSTVPEFLDWYRRRPVHTDRWTNWDNGERQRAFHDELRQKYARLWDGGFPDIQPRWHMPNDPIPDTLPWENRLDKTGPRLLMIVPWMTLGGADKFNLDVVEQLTRRGWEITIATTLKGAHSWLPLFAQYTPDIFVLHHFLRLVDYPRFLRYLIRSRQVDVVVVTNSELGYLLVPYLRAWCPDVALADYCHIEEEYWKNGGYPRRGVEYQELLDLNMVTSEHLKRWMVARGAEAERVRVCYIGVDTQAWMPDSGRRTAVRRELEIAEAVPIVLYAGRICDQKQPHVLAETMLRLCREQAQVVGLVAGDGPDMAWLRTFIKKHRLRGRVHLLGAVSGERVRDLMAAADVFFLPSMWEGIALSLYEAMASGIPVVGADVGGQRELVTPECGVLVVRSDADTEVKQYTEALTQLLTSSSRRREMGQAGRQRVDAYFRKEQMANRFIEGLQEAIRLHGDHPRPVPSPYLGYMYTAQAVEYIRLCEVAEGLWQHRPRTGHLASHPHLLDPHNDSWHTLAYFAIRRLLFSPYRALLGRGMTWLFPLKERLKRALLVGDRS